MRFPTLVTRVPALAIAHFIRERGAAYSGELLDVFGISQSTLRRRRPQLRLLGIEFVENGRGSLYVLAGLTDRLPTNSLPEQGNRTRSAQPKKGYSPPTPSDTLKKAIQTDPDTLKRAEPSRDAPSDDEERGRWICPACGLDQMSARGLEQHIAGAHFRSRRTSVNELHRVSVRNPLPFERGRRRVWLSRELTPHPSGQDT